MVYTLLDNEPDIKCLIGQKHTTRRRQNLDSGSQPSGFDSIMAIWRQLGFEQQVSFHFQ